MEAATAENLKERAREKMKEAKKEEMVLLMESWKKVTGRGELMVLIFVRGEVGGRWRLMRDWVMEVGMRKGVRGDWVLMRVVEVKVEGEGEER